MRISLLFQIFIIGAAGFKQGLSVGGLDISNCFTILKGHSSGNTSVSSNSMKHPLPTSILLLISLLSCKDPTDLRDQPFNDTTILLNQSLRKALSVQFMPGADIATRPYLYKDSILLTSSVLSLDMLPVSVDNHNFKILKEQEIVKILQADSNNLRLPNYLNLARLEANDSGYYVQVQNLSAIPFGGGGILGLYYLKKGDSLINVRRSASSIN